MKQQNCKLWNVYDINNHGKNKLPLSENFRKFGKFGNVVCHKQSPMLWLILNYEFYILFGTQLKEISISLIHPLVQIFSTKFCRKYRRYPHYLLNLSTICKRTHKLGNVNVNFKVTVLRKVAACAYIVWSVTKDGGSRVPRNIITNLESSLKVTDVRVSNIESKTVPAHHHTYWVQ